MAKWDKFCLVCTGLLLLLWAITGKVGFGLAAGWGMFAIDLAYQYVTRDDGWRM